MGNENAFSLLTSTVNVALPCADRVHPKILHSERTTTENAILKVFGGCLMLMPCLCLLILTIVLINIAVPQQ